MTYSINTDKQITLKDIQHILDSNATLALSDKAKQNIPNVHDKFFKDSFSRLEVAQSFIEELFPPELKPRLRKSRQMTIGMSMPEAPMHKNDGLVLRQNNVRLAGQITPMQSESQSLRMQRATHYQFRLRVFAANSRHDAAATFGHCVVRRRHRQTRSERASSLGSVLIHRHPQVYTALAPAPQSASPPPSSTPHTVSAMSLPGSHSPL